MTAHYSTESHAGGYKLVPKDDASDMAKLLGNFEQLLTNQQSLSYQAVADETARLAVANLKVGALVMQEDNLTVYQLLATPASEATNWLGLGLALGGLTRLYRGAIITPAHQDEWATFNVTGGAVYRADRDVYLRNPQNLTALTLAAEQEPLDGSLDFTDCDALTSINLSNMALDADAVDAAINTLADSVDAHARTGTLNLLVADAVEPTSASATALAALETAGWTVFYNGMPFDPDAYGTCNLWLQKADAAVDGNGYVTGLTSAKGTYTAAPGSTTPSAALTLDSDGIACDGSDYFAGTVGIWDGEPWTLAVVHNPSVLDNDGFVYQGGEYGIGISTSGYRTGNNDFAGDTFGIASNQLVTSQVQMLVVTWDGSLLTFYADGTAAGTVSVASWVDTGLTNLLTYRNGGYFHGSIKEIINFSECLAGDGLAAFLAAMKTRWGIV